MSVWRSFENPVGEKATGQIKGPDVAIQLLPRGIEEIFVFHEWGFSREKIFVNSSEIVLMGFDKIQVRRAMFQRHVFGGADS